MDDILDNIDFDIENNRTVFLKESDPFLPIISSPEIQQEPLGERLSTPPATPIHSPHAFLKEDRRLFSPPPVLTTEHAKLDNSEIGLNLTDNTDKRRKSPALRKRAARPKSLVLSSEENSPRKRVRPSTASTPLDLNLQGTSEPSTSIEIILLIPSLFTGQTSSPSISWDRTCYLEPATLAADCVPPNI